MWCDIRLDITDLTGKKEKKRKKFWLNFQGLFLLVYGLLTLLFSGKTGLMESPNNGNNNSGTNQGFTK